ncbi:MAG: hypothetical protein M1829_004927 [Trizodia sp. TS-e1964]|nr:MAG: hypothetical protein M1829_004927 [Trizodia sp. TS-e1964]
MRSFTSGSPIADASIARDVEEVPEYAAEADFDFTHDLGSETETPTLPPSSAGLPIAASFRRPSWVAGGPRPAVYSTPPMPNFFKDEPKESGRGLVADNHIISPTKPNSHRRRPSSASRSSGLVANVKDGLRRYLSNSSTADSAAQSHSMAVSDDQPTEYTLLLASNNASINPPGSHSDYSPSLGGISQKWEDAVLSGNIQTTWQGEAKTLAKYSRSLVLSFLLEYSLTVTSIFTVGHIGKLELGAASLASMTSNIAGFAIIQGLSTSLDTLCSQAYGSGHKKLVGLQLQRMLYFLWLVTIPIGIIFFFSEIILKALLSEPELAELAGSFLKVLIIGVPGYAAFEAGKRYLQAQGNFTAALCILLICAPLNAFMHWLFVWKFQWGFIGAPIAVVITDTLLPLLLVLYVAFVSGLECWGGFSKQALRNWGPMIRLALPGLWMIEAEYLAFELLTLASSYISTTHLAAQSILATIAAITYQIPYPLSIAASTRIANLIGASLPDAAKLSAKAAFVGAIGVGIFNMILLNSTRNILPRLLTNDQDVIDLVARILPLCAAFQLFDALSACSNGVLRGLGRQEIGGWVNLVCYYFVSTDFSDGAGS